MTLPELPQPNIPLLRKAVEWAEAEAAKTDGTSRWDQRFWATRAFCGTTYCIAGFVAMTGHGAAARPNEYGDFDLYVDGQKVGWSDRAAHLLGITDIEADRLFEGNNKLDDVREAAERIAARAGERL